MAVIPLIIFACIVWISLNFQRVSDWWVLRSYKPSVEIAELAVDAKLSQVGTDLFYVSDPKILDKITFNIRCAFPERSIVLGCYNGRDIYILDVEPGTTEIAEVVTAAHEMLHAGYIRLSDSEKERINALLSNAFNDLENQRVIDLVDEYKKQDPESLFNELHSILGTEVTTLGSELETYYSQYFTDRSELIAISKQYESIFLRIEQQIEEFDVQLAQYKTIIETNEQILAELNLTIAEERVRIKQLLESNQTAEYNQQVPVFNQLVVSHNELVSETKTIVNAHNTLVEKRNQTALEQNDLVKSLNSKFVEL